MLKRQWDPEVLRDLMKKANVTYDQIVSDSGIGKSTLNKIFNHGYPPSADILILLADYFNVPIDYLVGRLTEEQAHAIIDNYEENFKILRRDSYEASLYTKRPEGLKKPMHEWYESPWPYNLLDDIFEEPFVNVLTEDQEDGLDEAMKMFLTDRDQKCIYLTYAQGKTLDEAGAVLCVGRERVRQIRNRAVYRLRSRVAKSLILDGLEGRQKLIEESELISELRKKVISDRNGLNELIKNSETNKDYFREIAPFYEVLPDISVRSLNCLARANCKTVQDIINKIADGSILKVRNFGLKSYEEVVGLLKNAGFTVPEVDPKETLLEIAKENQAKWRKQKKEKEEKAHNYYWLR